MLAAFKNKPEMALGNAIGSVICNEGLALGLAGVVSIATIHVMPKVFKTSAFFLVLVQITAFVFVFRDYQLSRYEGLTLVMMFLVYLGYMYYEHKTGKMKEDLETEAPEEYNKMSLGKMALLFTIGLGGIILASKFVVMSATAIATQMGIPDAVIALTLVAFGTSVPEVATCVVSARKGHGDIAVGNIIGANILNICWVAGASSVVNNLTLDFKQIYFMFPVMFLIVLTRIFMVAKGYTLTKRKAMVLLGLYILYLVASIIVFPPN
jgi:cation:H+ antiporter